MQGRPHLIPPNPRRRCPHAGLVPPLEGPGKEEDGAFLVKWDILWGSCGRPLDRARCTSSGAASTWRSRAFAVGARRSAPAPDRIMREAMSHEEIACGFWPDDERFPNAAFYSYTAPAPPEFAKA